MNDRDAIPPELARVLAQFPWWHFWRGVGGLGYARLPGSSPPIVLRAATAAELAEQITGWEAGR